MILLIDPLIGSNWLVMVFSLFVGNTALMGANLLFEMLCALPQVKTI